VNTGSHKHETETMENTEKNPRPSGDLISGHMLSRHVPKEPHQAGIRDILCIQRVGWIIKCYPTYELHKYCHVVLTVLNS